MIFDVFSRLSAASKPGKPCPSHHEASVCKHTPAAFPLSGQAGLRATEKSNNRTRNPGTGEVGVPGFYSARPSRRLNSKAGQVERIAACPPTAGYPVRHCRAGSPHPAAFGDTAGSGHSALHSSALSSRALPIRLNANCRKRACSRFRGNNRPRAGFLRPHTDRFARAQRESPAIAWIQLGASCGQAAPTHLHRSPQPGSDTGRFQCPLETC
jgi:hypothetical protein